MNSAASPTPELEARTSKRASRRKKFVGWTLGVLGFLLTVLLTLLLCKDAIVKSIAERRIRERTGFTARIGHLETGFGSVKVTVKDFKLFNPPEFGGLAVFDIPDLFMELDAAQLAEGKVHFRNLRLHLAELNVIKGKDGGVNLKKLEEALLREPEKHEEWKLRFVYGGIEQMSLTVGQITYTDLQQPGNNQQVALDLRDERATDLRTEDDLRNWLGSLTFRLFLREYYRDHGKLKAQGLDLLLEPFRKK